MIIILVIIITTTIIIIIIYVYLLTPPWRSVIVRPPVATLGATRGYYIGKRARLHDEPRLLEDDWYVMSAFSRHSL